MVSLLAVISRLGYEINKTHSALHSDANRIPDVQRSLQQQERLFTLATK